MSICLPFLLYVCGFFSKDHAYTSIEDSMAIGDPRVSVIRKKLCSYHQKNLFQMSYILYSRNYFLVWNKVKEILSNSLLSAAVVVPFFQLATN